MTGGRNVTEITQFILLGFSDFPRITAVLFVMFLLTYMMTLTWNLSLMVLIRMDSHLHTPMYFFLSNLSFIDLCYVTSTVPKLLSNFFQEQQTISFVGCIVQYFFFSTMGLSESFILLSCGFIAASILEIPSFKGCAKALDTCASHLAMVTLFHGTALSVYTHHSSSHSTKQDKVLSVFSVILIPMWNPLIHSLRNKEIQEALTRVIKKVA
ncbi:OR5AN1-like, partial [Ictidomys tridecemlineatus]|uniref:G-protein coupled receptors family 1 profile domain-containing protein n=1 Tax=Ictidomys tridecemlineatus TaxID=43179 RepID=A0A287DC38_ICTTR